MGSAVRSLALICVTVTGCGRSSELNVGSADCAPDMRRDAGSSSAHDLSMSTDLGATGDLAPQSDLARDFAVAPDLAPPADLAVVADLSPTQDLSPPALDLASNDLAQNTNCAAGSAASPHFDGVQVFDVCSGARVVRTGDLDRDGRGDLVVSCMGSLTANVQVILTAIDGTPRSTTSYLLYGMAAPQDVAIADVNGDGFLDIVFAVASQLAVLQGHGDGTFSDPQAPIASVANPSAMVAGDFNGDGYADIAVAAEPDATTLVFLGSKDGLVAGAQYPFGAVAMVVADMNGDGYPDLALSRSRPVTVLHGNGDGTFSDVQSFDTGGTITRIAAADFNGDGRLDFAFVSPNNTGLFLSFQTAAGGFGTTVNVTVPPGFDSFVDVATVDLDGNGTADVVTVPATVFLGRGDGTFSSVETMSVFGDSVALGDLNGDGVTDAAFASQSSPAGLMPVMFGVGGGKFRVPLERDNTVFSGPIFVVDVDHDGANDVVSNGGAMLKVARGAGDGTLGQASNQPALPAPYARTFVTGDVNDDGNVDIVASADDPTSSLVWISLGRGDATFASPYSVPTTQYQAQLALADLDGDSHLDLVGTRGFPGVVTTYRGHGDGSFDAGWDHATASQGVLAFVVRDVNGDGRPDIVAETDNIEALINVGGGVFSQPIVTPQSPRPPAGVPLFVEEIDGDGVPDVVVGSSVYLGRGNGTFFGPMQPGIPDSIVAVADFNHDGRADLLSADTYVTIYASTGGGCFGSPVRFSTARNGAVGIGDLDGDGRIDVAVGGFENPRYVGDVLLNRTP
ncbi:MAG: hypothetical protein JWM82_749 [Myxococcales bacterium]|nr:hypothetical protein [Myxococcales bacterium]